MASQNAQKIDATQAVELAKADLYTPVCLDCLRSGKCHTCGCSTCQSCGGSGYRYVTSMKGTRTTRNADGHYMVTGGTGGPAVYSQAELRSQFSQHICKECYVSNAPLYKCYKCTGSKMDPYAASAMGYTLCLVFCAHQGSVHRCMCTRCKKAADEHDEKWAGN